MFDMNSIENLSNSDDESQDQRPRQQSLGGVLRREGNWKCLLLSALLAGCLAAAAWCRLAQVQRVFINFSVYPIKRTRQMSPCDDGYIYIPVAFMGLLYLVYLVECYHCTARLQLAHRVDVNHVADRVRAMRMAKPKVWWKAVCYHYVRRKRQITRYRNGDAYTTTQDEPLRACDRLQLLFEGWLNVITLRIQRWLLGGSKDSFSMLNMLKDSIQVYYERVNSHSASSTFAHAYCGFKDVSKNLILDSKGPITKIRFSKGFAFSNIEAASEFEDQRSRFFAQHERYDMYMEMREGLDLVGISSFKEYMVAYRDSDRLTWYSSQTLFWVLSCLLLSWPLRILIECNTSYVHYTVTKVFGVNYDTDMMRRQDLESQMSPYIPPASRTTRLDPTTASITSPQTAVLTNPIGVDSQNSSAQQINIIALARNKNNQDRADVMSHTSTIDSLELFATIRENCVLVPSYSEALLLSSANANDEDIGTIQEAITERDNDEDDNVGFNTKSLYYNNLIRCSHENTSRRHSLFSLNKQSTSSLPSTSTVHSFNFLQENPISMTSTEVQTDLNAQDYRDLNDQIINKSAIIRNSSDTPRKTLRIVEAYGVGKFGRRDEDADRCLLSDSNESLTAHNKCEPSRLQTTQSNYSLKTVHFNGVGSRRDSTQNGNKFKAQNRRSWAGFLSKPTSSACSHNRIHGARIRPINNISNRRNSQSVTLFKSIEDVNDPMDRREEANERLLGTNNNIEEGPRNFEEFITTEQIESIDRNLRVRSNSETLCRNTLYFSSPLQQICPSDPFGGREQTTPTEDPPPYEVAINLPVLRRITRSVTDRGELFGQSRAFIMDTLMNRRSCVDSVVSGTDSTRLLQHNVPVGDTNEVETNL